MEENCEIIYKNLEKNEKYEDIIKDVVNECFKEEKLDKANIYISITLTNEDLQSDDENEKDEKRP